jgi:hypothetical protein
MWDPQRLTTLWVFTACYRDSFTYSGVKEYCDVLRYWRRRSDCYFVLFSTSLFATTITFTICALHFRVHSLSWLVLWWLTSWLLLWSLVYLSLLWTLLWCCVSDRILWSPPDVAALICAFDLLLTLRSAPLICSFMSKSTLLSRSSRTGARTPSPRVVFCLQLSFG